MNTGERGVRKLFPIPEIVIQRSEPDLRSAGTLLREGERDICARQAPEWRRDQQDWPAHKKAHGEFMLKGSPDAESAVRVLCSVLHGVLTLTDIKRHSRCRESRVLAQVPLHDLAVGLRRGRSSMLTLATVHGEKMFDEIYCFADDPVKRNRWVAIFRRMGVPIFDLSADGHAKEM